MLRRHNYDIGTRAHDAHRVDAGAPRPRGGRRLSSFALVSALLAAAVVVPILSQGAGSSTSSTDLRVLLVGGPTGDPTTAAWAATLANEGVGYTEVDATGSYGSEAVTLPALTDPSDATHGLFNAVVIADAPEGFAAGQLTALFDYESTFNVRQIDGDTYPAGDLGLAWVGSMSTDPSNLAGVSGTTATLTTAGLAAFPSLKGPVPIDTGTYGYPATVVSPLPAGATETPLLDDAAGNVLMGVYQHPTAAQESERPPSRSERAHHRLRLQLKPAPVAHLGSRAHRLGDRRYASGPVPQLHRPGRRRRLHLGQPVEHPVPVHPRCRGSV